MPDHPPVSPRSQLETCVEHLSEMKEAMQFVQSKTGLGLGASGLSRERSRVLQDVARDLLLRARARGLASKSGDERLEIFEDVLSDVLLELFERDEVACWLITEAHTERIIVRRTSGRTPGAQGIDVEQGRKDARLAVFCGIKGGRGVAPSFRERLAKGTHDGKLTFWKYYHVAVDHAVLSAIGNVWSKKNSWGKMDGLEKLERVDPAHKWKGVKHSRKTGERALASVRRHEKRLLAMEEIYKIAWEGANPPPSAGKAVKPDPNCLVMLKFLDWLKSLDGKDRPEHPQTEFAKISGIPAGTVSSALKRFRQDHEHKFDYDSSSKRDEMLYTSHGGSQS